MGQLKLEIHSFRSLYILLFIVTLIPVGNGILYNRNPQLLTALKSTKNPHLNLWRQANIGEFLDRNEWLGNFISNIIRKDLPSAQKQYAKQQFVQKICTPISEGTQCEADFQSVLCGLTKIYGLSQVNCLAQPNQQSCAVCKNKTASNQEEFMWTTKVVDSMGKPPPGIEYGDMRWTGSFDQCKKLKYKGFQYCTIKLGIPMSQVEGILTNQTNLCRPKKDTKFIEIGFCSPSSCSGEYLTAMATKAATSQAQGTVCYPEVICPPPKSLGYDGWAVFMIIVCCFFVFLVFLGSMFDIVVYQSLVRYYPCAKDVVHKQANGIAHIDENGDAMNNNNIHHESTFKYPSDSKTKEHCFAELAWYLKLMMAFSAYTNGKRLLDINIPADKIRCIYGIRFFSMSWILYGHIYYFSLDYIANYAQLLQFPSVFWFQIVNNSSVAVDTFFLLSGFLLSYFWLKKVSENGDTLYSLIFWLKFYARRILRILPVYMIILGVLVSIWPYMGNGPLWDAENNPAIKHCSKNWWTNLLFLNNMVETNEMCMGWTWYLANDMQFFLLSPAVLVLLWVYPTLGILLCAGLIMISILTVALVISGNNYPPTFIFTTNPLDWARLTDFAEEVYFMPYARWPAYVLGLLLGYFMFKLRSIDRIGQKTSLLLTSVSFLLTFAIVFGLYSFACGVPLFSTVSALYGAVHRPIWAISVSIVIFVCVRGTPSYIGEVLSWTLWIPLSRLTFVVYLIHPLVILSYYASLAYPEHITHYAMLYHFISGNMLSYGIGGAFHLVFEAPLQRIQSLIMGDDDVTIVSDNSVSPSTGLSPVYQRFSEIRRNLQENFLGKRLSANANNNSGANEGQTPGHRILNANENHPPPDSGVSLNELNPTNINEVPEENEDAQQIVVSQSRV